MEQKILTEKQHEILGKLEAILNEAKENNIGFLFDEGDCSLTAFNAENVEMDYCGRYKEEANHHPIDWDSSSIIENFYADYFHSSFDKYYLYLREETEG